MREYYLIGCVLSRRIEHPALTHQKRRVVIMMFVVVVAFTICWLPFQLLKICNNLFLDENNQFKSEKARRVSKRVTSLF